MELEKSFMEAKNRPINHHCFGSRKPGLGFTFANYGKCRIPFIVERMFIEQELRPIINVDIYLIHFVYICNIYTCIRRPMLSM